MSETTSKREQLRAKQAADLKRSKNIRIASIAAALLVVLGLVLGLVIHSQSSSEDKATNVSNGGAAVSSTPSLKEDGSAMVIGAGVTKKGAPTVDVWHDFQCPGCRSVDMVIGKTMQDLAKSGDILLQNHTMTFLDAKLKNTSSTEAAKAAVCADTVGKYPEYYEAIYAGQSEKEGAGYTKDQLLTDFPKTAGITGESLTKFQKCYNDNATAKIVQKMDELTTKDNISSTPTYRVNGKDMDLNQLGGTDAATILASIKKQANA